MPSKPHYIPGESHQAKCEKCGEWLPESDFIKSGVCKSCHVQHLSGSRCVNCEHLDYCNSILWTLRPLPCFDNDTDPQFALCVQCGDLYARNHKSQKYCSPYCRHKAFIDKQRAATRAAAMEREA